jgi:hypothetical protein
MLPLPRYASPRAIQAINGIAGSTHPRPATT